MVKTGEQHMGKKPQGQHFKVQVQEVDYVLEVEYMGIKSFVAEKTTKYVVLHRMVPWDWMTPSPDAVIQCVGMIIMKAMVVVQNRATWMPRVDVG